MPPGHRLDEGRDHRELLLGGLRGSHFASADGGFYGDPFWHGPLEPLGCYDKALFSAMNVKNFAGE